VSRFKLNRLYFISSLKGNHQQTAEDLYNFYIDEKFENTQFINLESKNEFIAQLEQIAQETTMESGILLHIEAHGLDNKKGIVFNNEEQMIWEEMRPFLTEINSICGNNLSLCMSTCLGMYIVEELVRPFFDSFDAQCPFFCFVGPEDIITVDDLSKAWPEFYKKILECKNMQQSVIHMNNYTNINFKCDNSPSIFQICINTFADTWLKDRCKIISENPDIINTLYCRLYYYTYGKSCDTDAVIKIFLDENFYIDYFNQRRHDFLHINIGGDRYPKIDKITNFEKTIQGINIRLH
jgi:hypothetical protein